MYVKIHQANSWQWKPATVIEQIGAVNYNVFLEEQHRLIRSHNNQLKTRFQVSSLETQPTPLTIFFDNFGLTTPAEVLANAILEEPLVDNPDDLDFSENEEPFLDNPADPNLTDDLSDGEAVRDEPGDDAEPAETAVEERVQPATPILEKGRRMIQLPARFKPYWMTKP